MNDNFDLILPLLEFKSDDDFYHLQVLQRKKEHKELGKNSRVVKTYYIRSVDEVVKKKDEIINLCDFHNARAYINLNVRSFESIAFMTLKKVTDIIMNKDYKSVRQAYDSVCGTHFAAGKEKRWILDVDNPEGVTETQIKNIETRLNSLAPYTDGSKLITVVPTKNGVHLITSPFDVQKFSNDFPEIEIHKNNPTILYIS